MSAQPGTRAGGNPTATSSQVAIMLAQPGTGAGGNPTATSSQVAIMSAQPGTWDWGWGEPTARRIMAPSGTSEYLPLPQLLLLATSQ